MLREKGGFPKGWVLADVPPERKPERGYVRMFPRNENRNEGTFGKPTLFQNRPFFSQWALTSLGGFGCDNQDVPPGSTKGDLHQIQGASFSYFSSLSSLSFSTPNFLFTLSSWSQNWAWQALLLDRRLLHFSRKQIVCSRIVGTSLPLACFPGFSGAHVAGVFDTCSLGLSMRLHPDKNRRFSSTVLKRNISELLCSHRGLLGWYFGCEREDWHNFFTGDFAQRDPPMRALSSESLKCSHHVSQHFEGIRLLSGKKQCHAFNNKCRICFTVLWSLHLHLSY